MKLLGSGSMAAALWLTASPAAAAELDGRALGLAWSLPFAGLLLCIAVMPLLTPRLWHHHFGKVSAFWALATAAPLAFAIGPGGAANQVWHVLLADFLPFIILLLALFTVTGGIRVTGNLVGTPAVNTGLLALGTFLASWMGTTGASMLLIRPVIEANAWRRSQAHVIVFFIFLVSNIGGSLTPLGDPPLFLGFLKGVDFFWTTTHLLVKTLFAAAILLAVFYALDVFLCRREGVTPPKRGGQALGLAGMANVVLLAGVVGAVLLSGVWRPGIAFNLFGVELELQGMARDVLLLAIAYLSYRATNADHRAANAFTWGPILEVAKLFAGIFVTMVPVIAMLRAGPDGSMRAIIALLTGPGGAPDNAMYFWLTGILSSFLDNAPTYLVFFNAAGGDAARLMGPLAPTLAAISVGAVFMGANSYIGNAPNFMVKAIAEDRGIKMPSFFGYMLWSCGILVPLFLAMTAIFFR